MLFKDSGDRSRLQTARFPALAVFLHPDKKIGSGRFAPRSGKNLFPRDRPGSPSGISQAACLRLEKKN
jgi:hypothetical protein